MEDCKKMVNALLNSYIDIFGIITTIKKLLNGGFSPEELEDIGFEKQDIKIAQRRKK